MTVIANIENFDSYSIKLLEYSVAEAKRIKQKALPVNIFSYGGDTDAFNSMVTILKNSGLEIITMVKGRAMSCGAALFACGDKRYIGENARLMIHQVSGGALGDSGFVKAESEEVERVNKQIFKLLNEKTGNSQGYFEKLLSEKNGGNLYLDADMALFHGLATNIGIPDNSVLEKELFDVPESETEENKYLLLMKYAPDQTVQNNIKNSMEEKHNMSLEDLKNQIESLRNELTTVKNQNSTLVTENKAKDSQIAEIANKLLSEVDTKNFDTLVSSQVLTAANKDGYFKAMNELNKSQNADIVKPLIVNLLKDIKENISIIPDKNNIQQPENNAGQDKNFNPDNLPKTPKNEKETLSVMEEFAVKNKMEFDKNNAAHISNVWLAMQKQVL